ncbi:LOW QUALITY PROTEIN: myosin light chain kinase, smooth muscle-like [Haliotis rubra]|uniref:LOW QUALITY PROTEIN: myosin light chain kinase, smooth muscle-like n=1 Tax=Haliotis rubra TaxID=36100 RepID=UPI001EE54ABE|nr:LOW QUALITY PROTEIN: myosin light chain kinase, smooth muscle-like [Haliotis rubra]
MPEKTEVQLGGTKRFECRVIGYPRPDIKWYKDGVDITQNSRFNFTHTREGVISMLIEKVSRQDEGCYRCRAQNSEGMASTAAYLFVRTRKSKFLDDTPSVHSMSLMEASEKDLEHDREYKSKQLKHRKQEFEAMETEEYEQHISVEEQTEIHITDRSTRNINEDKNVSREAENSEESEGSFSSLEELSGTKDIQIKLEKMAQMYEEVSEEKSTKGKSVSFKIESESFTQSTEITGESDLTVESEVSISEERKSKKVKISIDESESASMSEESCTTDENELEEEIRRKEEQLSVLITQEATVTDENTSSSQLDVSIDDTKLSTQTADDSGLGISFSADTEERSFTEEDDSMVIRASFEVESTETENVEIRSEITEISESTVVDETTESDTHQGRELKISAETEVDASKEEQGGLSFEASVITDSSEVEQTGLTVSADVEIEEKKVKETLEEGKEEVLEKRVEETESLNGEIILESAASQDVAGQSDLVLPDVVLPEYKSEELGEQQSVSSVEDLSSDHAAKPRTTADEYYGEEDLVLPLVKQLPVNKTEEMKDQQSEGSVEDLPFDEMPQSQTDMNVEEQPIAAVVEALESVTEVREGPPEPEVSDIPESTAEAASMSLGPDSGIFDMSLQGTQFHVEELEVTGSSVDSAEHLESQEASKAKEKMSGAYEIERVPKFVSFEQHVSESNVDSAIETTKNLQDSEVSFVSKTEEEKAEVKKSQDVFMADGVSEENLSADEVQDLRADETAEAAEVDSNGLQTVDKHVEVAKVEESSLVEKDKTENTTQFDEDVKASAEVKEERGTGKQLVKQTSIETYIEQASLDDLAALEELNTIETDEKSQAGETMADVTVMQEADKEDAVETQSRILSEIATGEDNLSEIREAPQPAEVSESQQSQETESERAQVMPEELILQADGNVENTKQPGEEDVMLLQAEVDITETEKNLDETLALTTDVDVSEQKYDSEGSTLKMSATVDTEQVLSPPKVTRVPEDVSVQTGETIQLVSEVQGSPSPEVKWFREGDTVKPTERISLIADNDIYTLEIREASSSDAGTYTLTAHNRMAQSSVMSRSQSRHHRRRGPQEEHLQGRKSVSRPS